MAHHLSRRYEQVKKKSGERKGGGGRLLYGSQMELEFNIPLSLAPFKSSCLSLFPSL